MHTFDVIGMKIKFDDGWPLDQEARKKFDIVRTMLKLLMT